MSQDRPRQIVKLAAKGTKNSQAKIWLDHDPQGTWEQMARGYLEKAPARMEKLKINLTDEQVNEEISHHLRITALESVLAYIKEKKSKKSKSKGL